MAKKRRFVADVLSVMIAFALMAILVPLPVFAQCPTTLSLNITSGPYVMVDHVDPG